MRTVSIRHCVASSPAQDRRSLRKHSKVVYIYGMRIETQPIHNEHLVGHTVTREGNKTIYTCKGNKYTL